MLCITLFFYIIIVFQKTCEWTKQTAGGSRASRSYDDNPKIPIELIADLPVQLLIKIEANR